MLRQVRTFLNDRTGVIAVLFGLAMLPLALAMGVAVDYSLVAQQQILLQDSLDAAVLAGASLSTDSDSDRIEEAELVFAANFPAVHQVQPTVTVDGSTVTATASMAVPMAFMGFIGLSNFNISATAVAVVGEAGIVCALVLNANEKGGVRLEGNTSLVAENCWVYANSSHARAMESVGISEAEAPGFCAVGGYVGDAFTPSPDTGCPVVDDPFADLPIPDLACDHTDQVVFQNGTFVASEGVYCGGMRLLADAEVTLAPGLYVIRDGDLELLAHSSLNAEGVTFYFYGSDTKLKMHSYSSIDASAPAAGDYAGFVFVQDAGSSVGETSVMAGGGSVNIVGIAYFPTQILDIRGLSGFNIDSPYFVLIADTFRIRGNGTIHLRVDPDAIGYPDLVQISDGARLVQ